MQQADIMLAHPAETELARVVDIRTRHPQGPAAVPTPRSQPDPLEGLGSDSFVSAAARHRALHQASIERLFAQNEALTRLAATQRSEMDAGRAALAALRSSLSEHVAALDAADLRILEAEAHARDLALRVERLDGELQRAYEMIDGHRQAADLFLSDALSAGREGAER